MINTIHSDLIRGHIDTIILKTLYEGDRYGYDIVKEIENRSSGQYKIKQPTLYSCLKRLETQGFISSYWGEVKTNGGRRKYYSLTQMGKDLFVKNQTEWEYSRSIIDSLVSQKSFDLSALPPVEDEKLSSVPSRSDSLSNQSEVFNIIEDEELEKQVQSNEFDEHDKIQVASTLAHSADTSYTYLDTAKIMNELFNEQLQDKDDKSYVDKVADESYIPKSREKLNNINSDSYFKRFNEQDMIEESEESAASDAAYNNFADDLYTPYVPPIELPEDPNNAEKNINSHATNEQDSGFIKYDESAEVDYKQMIIEREYREALQSLIQTVTSEDQDDEVAADVVVNSNKIQTRKFKDITESLSGMGNDLKIRKHNDSAKTYSNEYYYQSNKLLLTHYAVLFSFMLLEIAFCFLTARIGLKIIQKYDLFIYLTAVIIAAAFPIIAGIMNLVDSTKCKRINFNFRNSMIFRFVILAQCLLIIYALNIYFGMPLGFSRQYLTSLLLPALLCLNIPLSAVVFNLLYKSKRYAVE